MEQTTGSQSADAVATTFKRLHPQAYLGRFLSSAIREDGRSLMAFRETTVSLGSITTADGAAFVRMGNTSCIAAVKAEIATPQLSRPHDGYLIPNVELAAVCSSKFKPGAPGNEAQVLTDRVLTFLNTSNLFASNSTGLCIHPGKAVWCLYLDISFICFDGNAFDAAILAAVGALLNTTLPKAVYDEDTEQVTCSSQDPRTPLDLANLPLSASFAIFENAFLLSDPNAFEAALSESHCTIGFQAPPSTLNPSAAQMSYLSQSASFRTVVPDSGKVTTDQANLKTCVTAAQHRCTELRQLLLSTHSQS